MLLRGGGGGGGVEAEAAGIFEGFVGVSPPLLLLPPRLLDPPPMERDERMDVVMVLCCNSGSGRDHGDLYFGSRKAMTGSL